MAKSEAEKKAYAKEYYEKYRKKGLTKGRKKGTKTTSKKTKKTSLVGLSTAGLNDQGKMQWALAKEKLSAAMNEELSNAGSQEEKDKIRAKYQSQALQELQKMKTDPSMAKEKKTSTKTKKTKQSASESGEEIIFFNSDGSQTKSRVSATENSAVSTSEQTQQLKDAVQQLTDKLLGTGSDSVESKIDSLTEEQRTQLRESLQTTIDVIKKKLGIKT